MRRSSSSKVRSRAIVSPLSVATAQPSRGVSVMTTSASKISTGSPSTASWYAPAPRSALTTSAAGAPLIAFAIVGVAFAKRLPSSRKFALTETSTRSASSESRPTAPRTFSSSVISRRRSAGSADHPSAATSARRSGWRVLTFDSARAARPSSTRRRTSSTFVAS